MPSVVIKCQGDIKLQSDWPSTAAAEAEVQRLLAEGARIGSWEYKALSDLWYSETLNLTIQIVD